jgi:hypothetical protein
MTRLLAAAAALFMLSLTVSSPAYAQRTGMVRIDVAKAGLIIGFQNGTGTLTFRGRRYPLVVRGVGAGITIGASSAVLTGQAFNLRRARDIAGKYTAAEAGLTVIGGGKAVRLRNENGVLLVLQGTQVGVELSLDLSGMEVAIAR